MRTVAVAAAVAAGAVVVLVGLALGWFPGGRGATPGRPLAASAAVWPRPALFGDRVTAELDVLLDRRRVDPASVRVSASFAPFAPVAAPQVRRTGSGRAERIRYRWTLSCLDDTCLPAGRTRLVRLPGVRIAWSGHTARVAWPRVAVATRLLPGEATAAAPRFRRQTALPAPEFAVSPGALADGLAAAAGLLAALAAGLVVFELRRVLRRRAARAAGTLDPLERALATAREAARRPDPADRRKALELLARTLETEGDPRLARAAADLAWAEPRPSGERTQQLADDVERALREPA